MTRLFAKSRWWAWAVGIAMVAVVTVWAGWRQLSLSPPPATPSQPSVPAPLPADRLFHPDLVIQSRSLSQLPKDLLAVPFLNTLLTEEYVFYYQQNESRLSLEGSLRRIAYEHDMGVGDTIIAHVLDTPAQVALWKNKDGKLKNYLVLLPKQGLVGFLDVVAKVAAHDSQLKRHAEVKLGGEISHTIWRLEHTPKRHLFFTTLKGHLAIFTDPTLLESGQNGERAGVVGQFISSLGPDSLGAGLRLPTLAGKHAIAVRGDYLSFGYQHFFPALTGMRFDFDASGWKTWLLASAPLAAPGDLWGRLPANPALCLAVPVDRARLLEYLRPFTDNPELPRLVEALRPPAALCWYGDSHLHTPLAVVPVGNVNEAWMPMLAELFARLIGSPPPLLNKDAPPLELLPVEDRACPGGRIWRRSVRSAHGLEQASGQGSKGGAYRHFPVTVALCHGALIFSPDRTVAERALAVLEKHYPPLMEQLAAGTPEVSLLVSPAQLAPLLRKSVLESLPPASEKVFRASVEKRLLPQLDHISAMFPFALGTPRGSDSWEPLAWHAF
ncbi:MAG: DUF2138 family protein [Magnetococcales bacterium]|nr:DUF2138 family protein [Magnetococcales bacterium]